MTLEKPQIDRPEGNPPADLEITDITVGDGDLGQPGHEGPQRREGQGSDASSHAGLPSAQKSDEAHATEQ